MNLQYQQLVYMWFVLKLKLAYYKVRGKILSRVVDMAISYYWFVHFKHVTQGAEPSKHNLKA